ncbi:IS30 family transposase [Gordonia sp. NPDC003424]
MADRERMRALAVKWFAAGVSVEEIGIRLGVKRRTCYVLLEEAGRPAGRRRGPVPAVDPDAVVVAFGREGTIMGAAEATGISQGRARSILVRHGFVEERPRSYRRREPLQRPRWKPVAERDTPRHKRSEGVVAGYDEQVITADEGGAGRYLSLADRLLIADLHHAGHSLRAIGARVGKHASTISRELHRHSDVEGLYLPHIAHDDALRGRARPKMTKLMAYPALHMAVSIKLAEKHSPEQIAGALRLEFPDDQCMQISHESVYQALYLQGRGALKAQITATLRSGRVRRVHRDQRRTRERFVDPMVMISDRPAEVEDRAVPGHWEGDLITGAHNKSAIGTLVERSTRYTALLYLPDGHNAEQVCAALQDTITALPEHLRKSLTWDQGAEMAKHAQFRVATGVDVYFCDPASPWQRGTNENTNGLLRQYFPKGTDLSIHGPDELRRVADELNRRPRKTLGFRTPAHELNELLLAPKQHDGVASTP